MTSHCCVKLNAMRHFKQNSPFPKLRWCISLKRRNNSDEFHLSRFEYSQIAQASGKQAKLRWWITFIIDISLFYFSLSNIDSTPDECIKSILFSIYLVFTDWALYIYFDANAKLISLNKIWWTMILFRFLMSTGW